MSNRQDEQFKVECERIGDESSSGKAISITVHPDYGLDGNDAKMWIPLSQVHEIVRDDKQGGAYLMVTPWIASQKGLLVPK